MKYLILISLICCSSIGYTQDNEVEAVKKAVDNFFVGFHQQDRSTLENLVTRDVVMQTIAKDKDGKTVIKTEAYEAFISSILAIPKDATFEEKLSELNIQIDGDLAHVWVPYEFWFNKEFSHCGVNSIQLVKVEDKWKIGYLIDTRRKENCIEE